MSYKDENGIWQAGRPPANRVELNLAEAPPPRGSRYVSEAQACVLLDATPAELLADPELLGGARLQDGELRFDAADVVARVQRGDDAHLGADEKTMRREAGGKADALLAEIESQGHELGPLGGGEAA